MREILFRGKAACGAWVQGDLIHRKIWSSKFEVIRVDDSGFDNYTEYEIATDTIGQFSGLTDKNGKKIFEGDVVKFTDSPFGYSYTGAVCFNEGSFCIKYEYWKKEKFHRIGQTDKWQDMGASGVVTYQYEILGNIHDNPELLENP